MILQSTTHTIGRLKVISGYAQLGGKSNHNPQKNRYNQQTFSDGMATSVR